MASNRDGRNLLHNYKGTIPVFLDSEVNLEEMLGNGSFCVAWTISSIHLGKDARALSLPHQEKRRALKEQINASSKSSSRKKTNGIRCIVKKPRTDLNGVLSNGGRMLKDLKNELRILSRVGTGEHPNVIQLHGIGTPSANVDSSESDNSNTDDDGQGGLTFLPSFLILSRIQYTVLDLIAQWKEQRGLGIYHAFSLDQDNTRQLWMERMAINARVADGLAYLHKKRIVIRDLKPENVGVDFHGVVKIFDFGLAKQIAREHYGLKTLYDLTGQTGTMRYMAPEVFKCKKYGHSADVYSLAIMMNEVLSLKMAFTNMASNSYGQRVCEKGLRPVVDSGWPAAVRALMQSMWEANPTKRPTASEVAKTMSQILNGNEDELYPTVLFSRTTQKAKEIATAPIRWFPTKLTKEESASSLAAQDASTDDVTQDSPRPKASPPASP